MEILITTGMVWPVSSDRWKAPLVNRYNGPFLRKSVKLSSVNNLNKPFTFHIFGSKPREAMLSVKLGLSYSRITSKWTLLRA